MPPRVDNLGVGKNCVDCYKKWHTMFHK
jgi:hypothetical protein